MIAVVGVRYRNYAHYTLYELSSHLRDRYNFYFSMTLKEMLTFLSPSYLVLQHWPLDQEGTTPE